MSEWKEYKLGDIAEIQTGPFGSQLHMSDYKTEGTPIITVEHLGENRILHNNLPLVGQEDWQRLIKYTLKEGDIVFSRVGSVDRRVYVTKDEDGWMFSGRCLRVRANKEKVNQKFLSFYFGQESFKETIRRIAVGATMPSINTTILSEVEISIPDIKYQTAIASVLSSFDDKIDLLHRQNKTLEQIAETIFRQWFVEEAEESWEIKTINSIASNIQYGYTQSASEDKVGPKFLRITDIQGGVINWDTVPYCKINEKEFDRYELKTGDVVAARTGASTGENIYLYKPEEAVFASYLIRLQFSNLFLARFIGLLMRSQEYRGYIEGILSGSAQPNANASELTSYQLQIPPSEKLEAFYKMITELDEKKYSNNNQIKTLTQLRDELLPKLMSGEVRVI